MNENSISTYNIIGSDWVYYKIYLGTKSADDILVHYISPLTKKLIDEKVINKWFFIRYNDPKFHLRLRFHCDSKNLCKIIDAMYILLNNLMKESVIWKVQIDTYNREVERYGINTMELSENFFFHDTVMITSFLETAEDENLRWLFGLKAIDSFLNLFEYKLNEKIILMESLSISFKNEIGKSKILNKNINDKYREYKNDIAQILDGHIQYNHLYKIITEKNDNITSEADFNNCKKKLSIPLNNFLSSHIHMLMNRLFKSKNRIHEAVCYDFLYRYYKSKMALLNNRTTFN